MIQKKKKAAIVIQFHNPEPNPNEIISLKQCVKVLGKYPLRFVIPEGLNIDYYLQYIKQIKDFGVIEFNRKRYFRNIRGYNRLLTSLRFYKSFAEFEYILLHHLDAFVFRDEMEYWIDKGYDLIGPPMYEYDGTIRPKNYIGVGTSGFSLKKVSSHIKVLKTFKIIYGYEKIFEKWGSYNLKGRLFYFPYFFRLMLGLGNNSHHLLNNLRLNDDIVWGILVNEKFDWFRVADEMEASRFGLEFNCEKLLNENNGILPFGCHQWYKRRFVEFWKEKIQSFNYDH